MEVNILVLGLTGRRMDLESSSILMGQRMKVNGNQTRDMVGASTAHLRTSMMDTGRRI